MALTGSFRGTGTHNTAASSFDLSPVTNFANATSAGVLVISVDNSQGGGAAHNTFTVTDSLGNTWTRVADPLYDPGSASAGVEGAMFFSDLAQGLPQTTDTITVTFGTNVTAKAWVLWEIVSSNGTGVQFVTGNKNTGAATATPTVTTGTLEVDNIVVCGLFNERGTDQTVTGDSDTTNGTWSSNRTTEIGSTTSGQTVASQVKTITSQGTVTYNPTLGVSSDVILAWIQLQETPEPITGSGAVTAATAQHASTAKLTFSASGTPSAPAATASGTAKLTFAATGAPTAPAATISGTGTVVAAGTVTGSGAVTAPAAQAAGTGKLSFTGTGAVTAAAATSAGTAKLSFTATGAVSSPAPTAAAEGDEAFRGTGALTAPAATVAAEGTTFLHITASGDLIAAVAQMAGTGTVAGVQVEGEVELLDFSAAAIAIDSAVHVVIVADDNYYQVTVSDEG